ncbi:MAG: LPS export ABC transporter periplasmic protein LptC [Ignavibacteria bacterium]|nr:LPS export ABC transporter periplasmic protein LptC [Ignavibacteria bacterium]
MRDIFVLFLFPISVLVISCSSDKVKPPVSDISADSIPSNESFNSKVVFSDSGNVKAILYAGRIRVFSRYNYTLIDSGAKVDFFKMGEYTSTLTGMRGKVYDQTKDVEVYDSVKLVSVNGSVLTTNRLYWVNKTQRIKTDDFVSIKTPNENIQGYGFESDQNLKDYVIYRVSGEIEK